MRAGVILVMILAAAAGGWSIGGGVPFARLTAGVGLGSIAAPLADDPFWEGILHYQDGRYDEAAESFRQAGSRASFNRGTALARAGRYREAIEAYTAVIARDPGDDEARANLALVMTLYDVAAGEARPGDDVGGDGSAPDGSTPSAVQAPGAGSASEGDGNAEDDLLAAPRQLSLNEVVRQSFNKQGVIASRQWLATLPDEPGRYLDASIAAEHRRRAALGLSPAPPDDPR